MSKGYFEEYRRSAGSGGKAFNKRLSMTPAEGEVIELRSQVRVEAEAVDI